MKKSKLFAIFQSLTAAEHRQLKKFTRSPFFNKKEEVIALCDYLIKNAPKNPSEIDAWADKKMDKQVVFQKIFRKQNAYDDLKMRHLMSDTFKLLTTFIAYLNYSQTAEPFHLLSAYRTRQLNKHFETTLDVLQKKQNNLLADDTFFYQQYFLASEKNHFLEKQHQRHIEPNLQQLSDHLDEFYLAKKLKCYCSMLSYQNLFSVDYQLDLVDELNNYLAKNWQKYPTIIGIYYHALLTLLEPQEAKHFQQLKDLLQEKHQQIALSELQDMFVLARNYCIKRLNRGDTIYLKELFELYQTELERGSILENGFLPALIYKNIAAVSINLQEYDWTEGFLEEYKNKIPLKYQENTYCYCLAQWYFVKKQYEEVVPLLQQIEYKELFLSLDARRLLLKTYYELDEEESLFSLIDSFRIFLRRKDHMTYHRNSYLNLLKFVQQLKKLGKHTPNLQAQLQQIQEQITQTKELVDKRWLLEKVEEKGM